MFTETIVVDVLPEHEFELRFQYLVARKLLDRWVVNSSVMRNLLS